MFNKISSQYLPQLTACAIIFITIMFITPISIAKTIKKSPQWQLHVLPNTPSLRGSAVIKNSLWVTGSNNAVFVSQNGGKSWQDKSPAIELKTDFRDIELFDQNTAIIMGVGSGKSSVLYKTINGGDTWSLLFENQDEQGFFDSIAFWDKSNGLLMGDPVDGYYVIKRTTDGGKTWRRIQKNNIPNMLKNEAAFAASGNTMIVGEKGHAWFTTGGNSASIYASNDFGETWKKQRIPLFDDTPTAGGYGLALNHSQQVFIVGGDYKQRSSRYSNMATFTNKEWRQVETGQHGLRTAMRCDERLCITTGKKGNDISYDGGASWQKLANVIVDNNSDNQAGNQAGNQGFYTIASHQGLFLAAGAKGTIGIYSIRN